MPTVSIPGSYISYWVGGGSQLSRTVGFERAAAALRLAGGTFARNAALAGTGYIGAGAAAASLAYEGYQMYRRRNKRSGSALAKPQAKRVKKYGARRGRKSYGNRTATRRKFVGYRAKSVKRMARGRPRMGVRRRKYNSMYSVPEFGLPSRVICKVGPGNRMRKMDLKLGYVKIVNRWQRVNTLSDPSTSIPGSLLMYHSTQGTATIAPMYIFRLNQIQQGTVPYNDGPMYQVKFTDTGNVSLATEVSQRQSGGFALDGDWQSEVLDPDTNATGNIRYVMNAWYDIRLMLHGCTSQPTVFDIMVISFTRGYLDPAESPSNAQEAADRHSLYQGLVQPYMSNPIIPRIRSVQGYRIHKRVRVALDPTLTVENDQDPKSKDIRLFVKDGSVYDYRYHDDGFGGAGADDKLSGVQWPLQGLANADYTTVPAPLARKYLVIRAMNTTRTAEPGASTVAGTPSFDIIVRKCEYQMAGN